MSGGAHVQVEGRRWWRKAHALRPQQHQMGVGKRIKVGGAQDVGGADKERRLAGSCRCQPRKLARPTLVEAAQLANELPREAVERPAKACCRREVRRFRRGANALEQRGASGIMYQVVLSTDASRAHGAGERRAVVPVREGRSRRNHIGIYGRLRRGARQVLHRGPARKQTFRSSRLECRHEHHGTVHVAEQRGDVGALVGGQASQVQTREGAGCVHCAGAAVARAKAGEDVGRHRGKSVTVTYHCSETTFYYFLRQNGQHTPIMRSRMAREVT